MAVCKECNQLFTGFECWHCGWEERYDCWSCNYEIFPKDSELCEECQGYICNHCGKCLCPDTEKESAYIVVKRKTTPK